jgi:hypothetical protein
MKIGKIVRLSCAAFCIAGMVFSVLIATVRHDIVLGALCFIVNTGSCISIAFPLWREWRRLR